MEGGKGSTSPPSLNSAARSVPACPQQEWCEDRDSGWCRQTAGELPEAPGGLHRLLPRRGLCYLNAAFPISLCTSSFPLCSKSCPSAIKSSPLKYRWLDGDFQDVPGFGTETPQILPSPRGSALKAEGNILPHKLCFTLHVETLSSCIP